MQRDVLDLCGALALPPRPGGGGVRELSTMASGLAGSVILKIAAEVRTMLAVGREVLNLTVGDFSPSEFPIPEKLAAECARAFAEGHTNYPPADGVPELKGAIVGLYERDLALRYPPSSVVVHGGGRPGIYAVFRAVVDPGERVVYTVPSWGNAYYCHLVGGEAVPIEAPSDQGFLPTAELLRPHLPGARLLCLNTPVNPCGTMIAPDEMRRIAELVLEENRRRAARGERYLYLLFDQLYWMLTFGAVEHVTPQGVVPELSPYVFTVDGISKGFAATGLRVGWTVAPTHAVAAIKDIVGHVGAWAPKPVQVATARVLQDPAVVDGFLTKMRESVDSRLRALYDGLRELEEEGFPVTSIPPQGAIYLSARFDLLGAETEGGVLHDDEAVRRFLLDRAGVAVVPFDAFGAPSNGGWFRLSVGAVSLNEIRAAIPRLRATLETVRHAPARSTSH